MTPVRWERLWDCAMSMMMKQRLSRPMTSHDDDVTRWWRQNRIDIHWCRSHYGRVIRQPLKLHLLSTHQFIRRLLLPYHTWIINNPLLSAAHSKSLSIHRTQWARLTATMITATTVLLLASDRTSTHIFVSSAQIWNHRKLENIDNYRLSSVNGR